MISSKETTPEQSGLTGLRINMTGEDNKWFSGHVTIHRSLDEIAPDHWNALVPGDSPILQHQFLAAFERTGCVIPDTGWEPHHLAIYDSGQLLAAAPCYLKYHSYGEYIFDWDWAHAYQQAGLSYYPKILLAIPFTPITGKCLLIHPAVDINSASVALSMATRKLAEKTSASSIHALFTTHEDNEALKTAGFTLRHSNQFHWRNQGYENFGDFLAALNSKRRKNILRERRSTISQGITYRWLNGRDATANDWSFFYFCYRTTIAEHGAIPYLNEAFFQSVGQTMPDGVLLLVASREGRDIAAAFFLLGNRSLFGRYWGAIDRIRDLHFETCFYQPIEYCIYNRLQRFEAGAQGEHKLNRGLLPTPVLSMHWLSHPGFFDAIQRYTVAEQKNIEQYQTILGAHSPYRKER
jgi:hypothetical protein